MYGIGVILIPFIFASIVLGVPTLTYMAMEKNQNFEGYYFVKKLLFMLVYILRSFTIIILFWYILFFFIDLSFK
jgi:hypothetical protein